MIPTRWVQVRHRDTHGYLTRIGPFFDVESWALMDDPRHGGFMEREDGEAFVAARKAPIEWDRMELVPAIACGCCGKWASYGGHPTNSDFREVAPGFYRCEKHVGRLPCLVEGCGKTFKLREGERYDHIVICGTHWRLVPLRIRRQCRLIRAKAKRYGWTNRLIRLYDFAWERGVATIQRGQRFDMTDVNRLFGWDD